MRRTVAVLAVLVVLLVGAAIAVDRIAASVVARTVATRVQHMESLPTRPDVHFGGFPFLTQAIRGRYDDVSVSLSGLQRGKVRLASVRATLHGVHVPLGAAIAGKIGAIPVDSVEATALLRYADLSAALPDRHLQFRDDKGRLQLRGKVDVLGQTFAGSALGTPTAEGQTLGVRPRGVTLEAGPANVGLSPGLISAFTVSFHVALPFDLQLRGVDVRPEGLVVHAAGNGVTLRGG